LSGKKHRSGFASKSINPDPYYQCCRSGSEYGSGSTGSTCFWTSRIRIH